MVAVPEVIQCFGGACDGHEVIIPAGDLPAPEYRHRLPALPTFPVLAAVLLDAPPEPPKRHEVVYRLADRNGVMVYEYVGVEVR